MKYFTIPELCCSSSHPSLVVVPVEGSTEYANLEGLIDFLLDPIRTVLGSPITVSSGYRPPRLNRAVGGSTTSNHVTGCAADCHTGRGGKDNLKIIETLLSLDIPYDECIAERAVFDDDGVMLFCSWVHIALRPVGNRSKLLYTEDGKTYHTLKVGPKLSK